MSLTPRKRYAAALTVTPDNSQLIMYGGCLVSSSEKFDCALKTNEMWSLSLRDYTWRLLNNQTAIAGGVQAQVGPGAIVGDVYYAYYNAYVYKYSLKSNTWLDLPARIEGANFRSMTDRDEGLLFAGGLEGAGTSSSVSQLQVDINKPLFVNWTDLPVKVRNPGLFSSNKFVAVYGGYGSDNATGTNYYHSDLYMAVDIASPWVNMTTSGVKLPNVEGGCLVGSGNKMYAFGGRTASNPLVPVPIAISALHSIDVSRAVPVVERLIPTEPLDQSSYYSPYGCAYSNNLVYVINAATKNNLNSESPVVAFNTTSRTWVDPVFRSTNSKSSTPVVVSAVPTGNSNQNQVNPTVGIIIGSITASLVVLAIIGFLLIRKYRRNRFPDIDAPPPPKRLHSRINSLPSTANAEKDDFTLHAQKPPFFNEYFTKSPIRQSNMYFPPVKENNYIPQYASVVATNRIHSNMHIHKPSENAYLPRPESEMIHIPAPKPI